MKPGTVMTRETLDELKLKGHRVGLYLDVSMRLLHLRTERVVSDNEETEWASVLETLWDDLDADGRAAVERRLAEPECRALVEQGVAYQNSPAPSGRPDEET